MNLPHRRVMRWIVFLLFIGSLLLQPSGQTAAIMMPGWIRQFGSSADDTATSVAVDGAGNSYVAGYTYGTLPGQIKNNEYDYDAFLLKYNRDGTIVWMHQFGTSRDDWAESVAVDDAGNIYVTGFTYGTLPGQTSSGGADGFVIKYDSSGIVIWMRQFGSNAEDRAYSVAVDPTGTSYIAGSTYGALPGQTSGGNEDAFVIKYDREGTLVWTRQFGTNANDRARKIAIDHSGSSYVTGATEGTLPGQTSSGSLDAFVRRYDSTGNVVWTHQFGSSSQDEAYSIAVDGAGNSSVAGVTLGSLPGQTGYGGLDAFVIRYNREGMIVWTRQFGSSIWAWDGAYSVAVDSSSNSYVAGHTDGILPGQTSYGDPDAFVIKYDSTGNVVWTSQFGSSAEDGATSVAVDSIGTPSVVGWTEGSFPNQISSDERDAFLVKFQELTVTDTNTMPLVTHGKFGGW